MSTERRGDSTGSRLAIDLADSRQSRGKGVGSLGPLLAWAVVFGIGLQLVPHEGANSPYGGLGLIALFTGFFIMMGFLWSVIGE